MLPWKLRKHQFLPVNQNLSSVHFSLAKFQLVSSNLSLAMIWQMTYKSQTAKTVFSHLKTMIKHRANILVVGLETLKMFLTLNVAMMIRVTFSLPDSLKMSARTRITALPLLIQKHSHSVFIWYLTIMETLSWISRINPCNGQETIKMKNLERNNIVSKITTSVGEDKRNNLLL